MTALFLFFPACQVPVAKPPLVETVAILPFDNESNDLNADTIMQKLVYWALKPSAYRVSDIAETNEILLRAGIVDGGQLPVLDPVKIAKDMNVQAPLYGSVEYFQYTNVGYYQQRKVTLSLRMVDGFTGQTLWENTQSASKINVTLDDKEAQKNFLKGIADQVVDKLFDSPLEEEAKLAVIKAMSNLPGYAFRGFAKEESPSSFKRSSKESIKDMIRHK